MGYGNLAQSKTPDWGLQYEVQGHSGTPQISVLQGKYIAPARYLGSYQRFCHKDQLLIYTRVQGRR